MRPRQVIAVLLLSSVTMLTLELMGVFTSTKSPPMGPILDPQAHGSVATTSYGSNVTAIDASPTEATLVGLAMSAYHDAGMELPELEITFHSNESSCRGAHGRFSASQRGWRIRICSDATQTVYEHELAHAWVQANVTEAQRDAFLELRGLDHWFNRDVPWNQRGTEWAAVIIQQGVAGLPLPPVLSEEVESRLAAFELLTGRAAPILLDWQAQRDCSVNEKAAESAQNLHRTGSATTSSR